MVCFFYLLAMEAVLAQSVEDMEKIMLFYGTDSPEDLDPYDVENLSSYLQSPLRINCERQGVLTESGLFTPYQVASLVDYRNRHGDVLSFEELAAVDGFGRALVRKIAPFISLLSIRQAGLAVEDSMIVRSSMSVRSSIKNNAVPTYGMRYKGTAGEYLEAGAAFSRTSESEGYGPDAFSGYLMWKFAKRNGKFLLGDFNARFGQGLALWNGMNMSGLTAPSSYLKRSSGISPSASFTGTFANRGVAVELMIRKVRLSAFICSDKDDSSVSVLPAMNAALLFKNGILSVTHYTDFNIAGTVCSVPDMKTSADLAMCLSGTDIFTEISYDWRNRCLAALTGIVFPVSDDVTMASMLRCYPSSYSSSRSSAARSTTKCTNEYGVSLSVEFPFGTIAADAACFPIAKKGDDTSSSAQLKLQAECKAVDLEHFGMKLRLSERLRSWGTPSRTELRTDFSCVFSNWVYNMRLNAVKAAGIGLLGYAECGYKADPLSVWVRSGLFRIDEWEDRIYVYERDAPGSFNVPAYYGRGVWSAVTSVWKFSRSARLYFRSALISYPFMKSKKSGRAELKLQVVCDF